MARHDACDIRQLVFPWSPHRTISAAAAAELLCTSKSTVCRMVREGVLKGDKNRPQRTKSYYRISYESLIAYTDSLCAESVPGTK
jgi:transposase